MKKLLICIVLLVGCEKDPQNFNGRIENANERIFRLEKLLRMQYPPLIFQGAPMTAEEKERADKYIIDLGGIKRSITFNERFIVADVEKTTAKKIAEKK